MQRLLLCCCHDAGYSRREDCILEAAAAAAAAAVEIAVDYNCDLTDRIWSNDDGDCCAGGDIAAFAESAVA